MLTLGLRGLCALLCLMMLAFMGVQYNDPDGLWWMAVYAVPAFWSALVAVRPATFVMPEASRLLGVSVLFAMVGMFWYWPISEHWWSRDIWWNVETAREGMGMMIVFAVLLLVVLTARLSRRRLSAVVDQRDAALTDKVVGAKSCSFLDRQFDDKVFIYWHPFLGFSNRAL